MSSVCAEQKQRILELRAMKGGVEAAKVKKELKNEKNKVKELQTKLEATNAAKAKDEAEINSLKVKIKFFEDILDKN